METAWLPAQRVKRFKSSSIPGSVMLTVKLLRAITVRTFEFEFDTFIIRGRFGIHVLLTARYLVLFFIFFITFILNTSNIKKVKCEKSQTALACC